MRRASCVITLCTVMCLVCAQAVPAEQEPPKEDAPAAQPAAAQPAKEEPAKAEPKAAEPKTAEPAASKRAPLDAAAQAAIADWAKKLGSRAKEKGAYLTIGDICEVKPYKQEKLQGFGLVLDLEEALKGPEPEKEGLETEEEAAAASDARLTELLTLLNAPVAEGVSLSISESLRVPGVLTLVAVTAAIPPEGVQKGDRIDCEVRPLGGKSVDEGYLLVTQLAPPGPKTDAPAALAAGPIVRESSYRTGGAKVLGGCLMQADVCDQFVKEEKITLILDEEHAEFPIAQDLVNLINTDMGVAVNQPLAKAPSRFNVEVTVPEAFAEDPVAFVTLILRLETQIPAPEEEKSERRTFSGLQGIR
ncbi:MAG TPA: flagellar basal body P-ring protein FlgI [Thermoguttaceae bacterium]|nr:flagellar basal body P-ring protein FlgI [Thermoguttaceae bacterium]